MRQYRKPMHDEKIVLKEARRRSSDTVKPMTEIIYTLEVVM